MSFLQITRRNNYTPFYDCLIVKRIWNQLKTILSNTINFLISMPQSAIFGIWDLDTNELKPLAIYFQMYIYNARATGYLNISHLLIYIKGIKNVEKKLCEKDAKGK